VLLANRNSSVGPKYGLVKMDLFWMLANGALNKLRGKPEEWVTCIQSYLCWAYFDLKAVLNGPEICSLAVW